MKKRYLGLFVGVVLVGISFLFIGYMGYVVATEYPNTEVILAGEELDPGTSTVGLVEIYRIKDFFIGVRTIPASGPHMISLIGQDGQEIIKGAFDDLMNKKLSNVPSGLYKLEIQNLSPETAKFYVIFTEKDMSENFDEVLGITMLGFSGLFILLPGLVILAVSGGYVIFVRVTKYKVTRT